MSYARCAFGAAAVAIAAGSSFGAMNVLLDFNANWVTDLNNAAVAAGVPAFNLVERSTIEANIKASLELMYQDFDVSFSTASPGGSFTTINFGAGAPPSPGVLGEANNLDFGNHLVVDTVRMYLPSFPGFIENFEPRAQQITEMSFALAGTAGHELFHSLGGEHNHAYGVAGISPLTYGATGGLQNPGSVMATGPSGLTELGREVQRSFNRWEKLILDIAGGFNAANGGFGQTGTSLTTNPIQQSVHDRLADVGSTPATAQALTLATAEESGYRAAHTGGTLTPDGDVDFFKFTVNSPGTVSIETFSTSLYNDSADTTLQLFDTDGVTSLAFNDDISFNGNTIFAGGQSQRDSWLLNIPINAAGTYFIKVAQFAADGNVGDYSLLVGFDPIPAPGAFALLAIGGLASARRRRMA
ncbi:MAG TPA: hypothetical protein DEB06_06670 [Phycisphaerales bacterium]|nr:hypothetical protein [Phycisphaerales bacterium]